jgi:hypothetical protein
MLILNNEKERPVLALSTLPLKSALLFLLALLI